MKMRINRILTYKFSKCYDLISVGPYANRVAKTVNESTKQPLSILTVQQEKLIVEPSLVPITNPVKQLEQNNYKFSDIQMGVGIRQINPDRSYIVLKNGKKYNYKQLVYSGNPSDWKGEDSITTETSKIKDYHSFVYDDMDYANINELFSRRSGSIVFTVPKDPHFGYQNYFMMYLKSRTTQNKKLAPQDLDPVEVSVICQGQNLVPYNQAYNTLLEQYLAQTNIKLIKNAQYSIDYKKKTVKTNKTKQTINFNALFHYLPLQIPKVLTNAKINPFLKNRHTLHNNKYENIFILGNIVNNAYSLSSVNEMSKVIAQNVMYNNLGIRKKVLYQGYSSFNIWLSDTQCHYIETDYNSLQLKRSIGQSKLTRLLVALHKKSTLPTLVNEYINISCDNFSIFNQPQIMNTARSQVPALIQKNTTNANTTLTSTSTSINQTSAHAHAHA